MSTPLPPGLAARAHRALESLHGLVYFADEVDRELIATGLEPGRMCYFASRSAAMGPVVAGVTAATFYNFNPALIARHIPRAWTLASPADVLEARLSGADQAMTRLLGSDALAATETAEAAELAREATQGLDPAGRALFASHAELPWPEPAHLVLWHAATLLREYRGDGHVAALLASGLSGIEAIVSHTATGRGFTEPAAKSLRGWSDEQWAAAVEGLQAKGILDADGGLTPSGVQLREAIEEQTDRMAAVPWLTLGVDRTERLIELGKGLSRVAVKNGAFPRGVFASFG